MTYKFDQSGGFWAIDDINKVAEYAYPTSLNATDASRSAKDAMMIATLMISAVMEMSSCIPIAKERYTQAMNAK